MTLPVVGDVYPRLWANATPKGQLATARRAIGVMSKAVTFQRNQIAPLPPSPPEFTSTVLNVVIVRDR